jgi:hypothetical protein
MRRITSVLAVSASTVLLASAIAYAATPDKVRDDPGVNENTAAASPAYFAWSQNLASRPSQYNAYVRPTGGGSKKRVNPVGTRSFSVGIDGSRVVYQSTPRHGGNGNLRFYDAAAQTRPSVPDGVNTRAFENRPTLSGDWLLFTRDNGTRAKVILFNVTTQEQRVLRSGLMRSSYLVSDQVNGDWATYERCDFDRHNGEYSNCNVFRYTISTKKLVKIANPGQQQYAAAISQDGTIYMVRTGGPRVWQCGQDTRIVRYPLGGPATIIATIGSDALTTFATDETDTSTTLYIDKFRCNANTGGIYRIPNADTAT